MNLAHLGGGGVKIVRRDYVHRFRNFSKIITCLANFMINVWIRNFKKGRMVMRLPKGKRE